MAYGQIVLIWFAPAGAQVWLSAIPPTGDVDTIVDVAHTLADAYQKAGDLPAARRAAMRGLLAEPVSEILCRDLLRIEYRAGNLAAVRQTADKLVALAASLELELDEETSTLLADRPYRASIQASCSVNCRPRLFAVSLEGNP